MSVGISIYRVVFKNDEEEIATDKVYEKKDKNVSLFGQMKKEEVYDENDKINLFELTASIFENKEEDNNFYQLKHFSRKDANYFGKFFYGNIIETDKSLKIDNQEIMMTGGKDISRDEFYFALFQADNVLLPEGNKTAFLFLQTNGNVGIKTKVIDKVYLKRLRNKLSDLNKDQETNIKVEIASYNITEEKISKIYENCIVDRISLYKKGVSENLKKGLEGENIKVTKHFAVYNNKVIEGLCESFKNLFKKNKRGKSVYEIILEDEITQESEIVLDIKKGKRKRKLIKKSWSEKIENIQSRFDVTEEYDEAKNNEDKIYAIFFDLFCDIIINKEWCKMLKIMFLIIFLCIIYIFFPKIHLHEIVVEEFRLLKKESKIQAFIFYIFPIISGIFISHFPDVGKNFDENMGNYLAIVSIFSGFLLNIAVFLDTVISKLSEKRRIKEEGIKKISKEVNTIVHYSLLVGFLFLMLCILEIFFGYNKWIMRLILISGIHFLIGMLMIYRAIYLMTKNAY